MNSPQNIPTNPLPWTKEQFRQMKTMLEQTIPAQEDNLRRAALSGLDVAQAQRDLADHKQKLQQMVSAWEDKYT